MIHIPKTLQTCRFIKTKEKIPSESGWNTQNNYDIDSQIFQSYIKNAKTYGVLCGIDKLVVLDADDEQIQQELLKEDIFKNTFIVKSAGKGLFHFYFYADKEPESTKCLDKDNNTLFDVQGIGKQVIGPGSELSNGKKYEVVNDVPIKKIKYEDILSLVKKFGATEDQEDKKTIRKTAIYDETNEKIKDIYPIRKYLRELGINTQKQPTDCPFHSSKGGKCFSYTEKLWNCFHCGKKGDIFNLVMYAENCGFYEAKQKLMELSGLNKEKEKEEKKNQALKEYKEIAVVRHVRYKSKDETLYKIYISDFYITLTPDEILNPNTFRKKYFNETGILLKPINTYQWADLTNEWVENHGEIIDQTNDTTENHILETFLNEISNFSIVFDAKEAMNYGRLYYNKETKDRIYISHKAVDLIIRKNQYKLTISKMRYILDGYIFSKSDVFRTGKTTNRFMALKRQMINIKFEEDLDDNE